MLAPSLARKNMYAFSKSSHMRIHSMHAVQVGTIIFFLLIGYVTWLSTRLAFRNVSQKHTTTVVFFIHTLSQAGDCACNSDPQQAIDAHDAVRALSQDGFVIHRARRAVWATMNSLRINAQRRTQTKLTFFFSRARKSFL